VGREKAVDAEPRVHTSQPRAAEVKSGKREGSGPQPITTRERALYKCVIFPKTARSGIESISRPSWIQPSRTPPLKSPEMTQSFTLVAKALKPRDSRLGLVMSRAGLRLGFFRLRNDNHKGMCTYCRRFPCLWGSTRESGENQSVPNKKNCQQKADF